MDKIETMRAFATVAAEGSFTAAARRLGMSTKLASKYVQQLEARLEIQLFNRTTRSVTLTDTGAAYLDQCRALIAQMDELDALVQEKQTTLAGPIRITAPTGFGSTRLSEALVPFLAKHRQIEIDLKLSDSRLSLVEEGLDLAIRIGPLRNSALIVRQLADMPLILCAAPRYLAARGTPRNPAALASHDCLAFDDRTDANHWRFWANGREYAVKITGRFRANSPAAQVRMAEGGLGISRSPLYAVEDALASGRLVRLLTNFAPETYTVHALYPPSRHLTARVRALIDHLAISLKPGTE